ncbi:hypothetical protein [uncultured Boseongicola sp.]|uniref:hypothetical protein n=1 Tax=uncultured Boseongicola sp. TaxID=1648499 RepID=UPI00261E4835|nr:hypothetical protein [uncultured Boseongicola sp.]
MNWTRTKFAALVLVLATEPLSAQAAQSGAGEPLSAIDWLSDSVSFPPAVKVVPPIAPPASPVPTVTVSTLGAPVADDAGLFPAEDIGLSETLWGLSSASDLARALLAVPEITTPTLRAYFASLIQADFNPPVDAAVDNSLFLARLDTLLALAKLDEAEALIEAAGPPEPQRFRRSFDIALLKGTEAGACQIISTNQDISPTFPTRIFCLARNGEWDVAALTLGTAEALGILSNTEDQLLLHFLDPDLFEGEKLLPRPASISPLLFRLYEAIGERPQTDALPMAFGVADLSETVGWRIRLRAAERLTAAGALSAEGLLGVMSDRRPSASGGIWSRVAAIQAVRAALVDGNAAEISRTLPPAWDAAVSVGYHAALAPWIAEHIQTVTLQRRAHHTAFEIALFSNNIDMARQYAGSSADDQTLLAILTNSPFEIRNAAPLAIAVRRSLSGLAPSESYRMLVRENRRGEALLKAIAVLAEGMDADPNAIADALSLLMSFDLDILARRISAELLLEDSQI